ncbi:tRNA (adenosine(37)-N6)-dimethylallyltransferase MiaA [Thiohalobacter thiocyanaticus]|uniref:tRNA dimethylallyltransferase n=1 Tax=Thiohalobacter thiocyanaticus TaxID=585455 RepID=A0A426QLM4_9GAMM|nr:tRNA (adenosine(37)-N6)-dimethylallyltransferase MiaA [Thiohalobacter thiocyanaticus]RRQ22658.1 tRNA (adenosine(37)-N6)-dimethylallyltransferase MiaA [Thiohalobacter thiocyanaticus]
MERSSEQPVVCLMGPTAAGKTDLAVALVEALPLEIVSVDSVMVYRDMDIGSAKPDAETLRRAPHHLIDFLDPAEAYSAARFVADAERAMAAIRARGRIPLLVGGTGLYFRALEQGLAPMPEASPELRAQLAAELAERGTAALHARLAAVDPEAAARIHPNDPQRIQRALEVHTLTGRPQSEFHREQTARRGSAWLKLVIAPEARGWLHARIERRFNAMLEAGFVDEVEHLYRRGDLSSQMPSMRAVGYRQVWQYLAGEYDYEEMRLRGVYATRQYAKRQLTWLRGEQDAVRFAAGQAGHTSPARAWLARKLSGWI